MRSFVILMSLFLAACAQTPVGSEFDVVPDESAQLNVQLREVFELGPGQVAAVAGGAMRVTFSDVLSDSRCPSDVVCVWAGNAEVRIGYVTPRMDWMWTTLNTSLQPQRIAIRGYGITLVSLSPYPRSTTSTNPDTYVAELRVEAL